MSRVTGLLASIPSPGRSVFELGPLTLRAYGLCSCWGSWRRSSSRGSSGCGGAATGISSCRCSMWGVAGGHRRRPALPRDHELGRGARRVVGRLRRLEGRARHLGRRRGRRRWPARSSPSAPAPTSRCSPTAFAPGILLAQGIGRFGNYFNQELFGKPTTLPWALEIDPAEPARRGTRSPRRSIRPSSTRSSGTLIGAASDLARAVAAS